jgi:hypothetical protein
MRQPDETHAPRFALWLKHEAAPNDNGRFNPRNIRLKR